MTVYVLGLLGLECVSNVSHLESKIAVLENMLRVICSDTIDFSDFYSVLFSLSGLKSYTKFMSLFWLTSHLLETK